jgi:hypothetical protein
MLVCCFSILLFGSPAHAEPQPGDIFREYPMALDMWRVGERHEWGGQNWGKNIALAPKRKGDNKPYQIDLEEAIRAELTIGYVQCHPGTKGLAASLNDNEYMRLPVPDTIPPPREGYLFWPYPTVDLPLSYLKKGENQIKFRIDSEPKAEGEGGWFQNLVYTAVLRVYYKETKAHPKGEMAGLMVDGEIGKTVDLAVDLSGNELPVRRVEYIGYYEDLDQDGDGIYQEWQYRYDENRDASLIGNAGSSEKSPFAISWDTTWLPDQREPVCLAARIVGENGVTYLTKAVTGLTLKRPGLSVEICKPYDIPQPWVTRNGRMGEKFAIRGDLEKAIDARAFFRGWGGNDGAGCFINNQAHPVFDSPRFEIPLSLLKPGVNSLESDKGGHHGLEVNWPGVVVLVRYRQD